MADPARPETPAADALEQRQRADDPALLDASQLGEELPDSGAASWDAPEADAAEQRRPVLPDDGPGRPARSAPRDDVDEADAAEQSHDVGFDDDDYR